MEIISSTITENTFSIVIEKDDIDYEAVGTWNTFIDSRPMYSNGCEYEEDFDAAEFDVVITYILNVDGDRIGIAIKVDLDDGIMEELTNYLELRGSY